MSPLFLIRVAKVLSRFTLSNFAIVTMLNPYTEEILDFYTGHLWKRSSTFNNINLRNVITPLAQYMFFLLSSCSISCPRDHHLPLRVYIMFCSYRFRRRGKYFLGIAWNPRWSWPWWSRLLCLRAGWWRSVSDVPWLIKWSKTCLCHWIC